MSLQSLSKDQFDMLFQNSKDFIYFMEKNGEDYRYIYLNNSSIELLSDKVIGKTIAEVMKVRDCETITNNYHEAVEKREQVSYQDYIYFLSEVKKYETTVIPIFDGNRTFVLAITKEIAFDRNLEDKYLFMRSVFFNSFLSTVLISNEGKLLEANPQFLDDFNLNIEDVRLKDIIEMPFISNHIDLEHYLKQAYNGESLTSKLLTFIDKDDNCKNFTATFSPLFQEEKVVAVFIILQEVTKLIEQEKELRLTYNGLSNFQYAINSVAEIIIMDSNCKILDVNDRFTQQMGYTREELIGNTLKLIDSRTHSKQFFDNIFSTVKAGEVWRGEICNRTKQGVPYWAETTIIPFFDEDGNISQYINVYYDISEKKRMMTELQNIEHMFKLITENTNDLIVVTNEDGIILYVSTAYTSKLGFKKEELIGQFYSNVLAPESKNSWNKEFLSNHDSEASKIDLIHQSRSGDKFWTECNYTVVKDYVRNHGIQIIMVAREINDRKEIENQLSFLAFHDSLTQLPNRRYLQNEFSRIVEDSNRGSESFAVLYVDGDNFKNVNDQFGHKVGDEFIIQFGKALTRSVRGNDLVVRMGGDEFAIILTGLVRDRRKRTEQVKQIVERINENLQQGWLISNQLFAPTASIGISFYPDHGVNLENLLSHSDKALYGVKMTSKNNYNIYSPELL
ncbi:diguanylate cyclase domain-containing protein [Lysinibacillus sp. SGAir0095]|uniref:diguanylate cyclase domain-containing protein n=1 Tax=Lysinibacillus sp. SGAir0095 TaxID=2070463 RepID=UPI0010CCC3F9|nr:diguanylate cyclase [Lysinibacillus sp. SGAir0095]QCR32412.1 PAS domain S-box protein [Lysinibacillus sp. SGAir0095]